MIKYNDLTKDIGEVFYSGHQITEVFIGTSKVFPDSPTPPPTPVGGKYRFTLDDQSVVSADCDSSSAITSSDISPYRNTYTNTLVSAEIGDCVTSIGQGAFSRPAYLQNDKLTNVTIGNNVTTIYNYAFQNCSGLTSVVIPDSVTTIDTYAFEGCSSITSLTISNNLTTINSYVFNQCSSLPTVTIPNSVTTIDSYAFYSCSGLTSVNIGSGVTSIGQSAFNHCSSLTSVTIPNSVTSIGNSAFNSCSGLTSCTIGSGVTSIGTGVFQYCSALQKVIIPNIAGWCALSFSSEDNPIYYAHHIYSDENTEITNLVIPNSVTSIGQSAFENCYGLTSVTIPNSVTNINKYVFYGCSGLTSVTVNAVTPPTLGSAVFGRTNNCPIYVPAESVEAYKTASGWSTYANRIQAIPT